MSFFYVTFYFNFIAPNDISQDIKRPIHYHSKCGNILKSWSSINLGDHFLCGNIREKVILPSKLPFW